MRLVAIALAFLIGGCATTPISQRAANDHWVRRCLETSEDYRILIDKEGVWCGNRAAIRWALDN